MSESIRQNKVSKDKKKKYPPKPRNNTCMYCGGKNFEQIAVGHVGVIRICKDCKEEQ